MGNEERRRVPTSRDVARLAGVSQSAVSLVFSGKDTGRVTEATRKAILSVADELGYRPNASARALKLGTQRLFFSSVFFKKIFGKKRCNKILFQCGNGLWEQVVQNISPGFVLSAEFHLNGIFLIGRL